MIINRQFNKERFGGKIRLGVPVKIIKLELGKGYKVEVEHDEKSNSDIEYLVMEKPQGNFKANVRHEIISTKTFKEEIKFTMRCLNKDDSSHAAATDYFVVDELPEVVEAFGKRPKDLIICFSTDDIDKIINNNYRYYRAGLNYCIGNGETASRMNAEGRHMPLPYCECPFLSGLPEAVIPNTLVTSIDAKKERLFMTVYKTMHRDEETHIHTAVFTHHKVNDEAIPMEIDRVVTRTALAKDVSPDIRSRHPEATEFYFVEELRQVCKFKFELRFLIPATNGILPYVIRSTSTNSYSYIRNMLETVMFGVDKNSGLGYLKGILFKLSIVKDSIKVLEAGELKPRVFPVLVLNTYKDSMKLLDARAQKMLALEEIMSEIAEKQQVLPSNAGDESTETKTDNNAIKADYKVEENVIDPSTKKKDGDLLG